MEISFALWYKMFLHTGSPLMCKTKVWSLLKVERRDCMREASALMPKCIPESTGALSIEDLVLVIFYSIVTKLHS